MNGFYAKRSERASLTALKWRFAQAQGAEPLPPLAGEDWGESEPESGRDTIGPAVVTTHRLLSRAVTVYGVAVCLHPAS